MVIPGAPISPFGQPDDNGKTVLNRLAFSVWSELNSSIIAAFRIPGPDNE